jgi:hypothetical protein
MATATTPKKIELEELAKIVDRAPDLFEALAQDSDAPLKKSRKV